MKEKRPPNTINKKVFLLDFVNVRLGLSLKIFPFSYIESKKKKRSLMLELASRLYCLPFNKFVASPRVNVLCDFPVRSRTLRPFFGHFS